MKPMRSTSFLVVMALAAMTNGAPIADDDQYLCCPPGKFSATMYGLVHTIVNDTTKQTAFKYNMNVDYDNKAIAVQGQLVQGQKVHVIIHPTYAYVINDDTKSCDISRSIPYTPRRCLPKTAKYVGDITYGNLTTKAYWMEGQGSSYFFAMKENCLAVNAVTTFDLGKEHKFTSTIYSDIKPLADSSAFVPPSYCPKP